MTTDTLTPGTHAYSGAVHAYTCPTMADRRNAADLLSDVIHALPIEWGRIDDRDE